MSRYREAELQHFGVKGMRWGVRKDRKGSSGGSAPKKKTRIGKTTRKIALANAKSRRRVLDRATRSGAKKIDKINALFAGVRVGDLVATRSIRKSSKKASERESTFIKALESGNDSIRNTLKAYGNVTPADYAAYTFNRGLYERAAAGR